MVRPATDWVSLPVFAVRSYVVRTYHVSPEIMTDNFSGLSYWSALRGEGVHVYRSRGPKMCEEVTLRNLAVYLQ